MSSSGAFSPELRARAQPGGFAHRRGDIADTPLVNGLVARCEVAFHLAAAVGVRLIVEQAVHTILTNVRGTEVLLHAADLHGCKVFIASTSEVYGRDPHNDRGTFREDDDLSVGTSMRWCYAASKAVDEYLARAYYLQRGLPVVIGRLFNTVGPRQSSSYGMVLPRFVEQALTGKPITIYGDGLQVRSFTWVGDRSSTSAPTSPSRSRSWRIGSRPRRAVHPPSSTCRMTRSTAGASRTSDTACPMSRD